MNRCGEGGWLVHGEARIPTDDTDFHVDNLPVVGCSRLRCPACGQVVRNAAGYAFASQTQDVAAVHATPELTTVLAKTQPRLRLYLCRCRHFLEQHQHRLEEPDPDHTTDPGTPWRCEGHPLVTLPHDIDGVVVAEDAIAELVRRNFGGWSPPGAAPAAQKGARWAARLHGRLRGTAAEERVAAAAAALLDDPSPLARAHALHFFYFVRVPVGLRRILALLEGDRAPLAGVADPVSEVKTYGQPTLEESAWRDLYWVVGNLERARQLARRDATTPGRASGAVYDALAQHDMPWLVEHAEEVVRANPGLDKVLVKACKYNVAPDQDIAEVKARVAAAIRAVKG
jgi:hypothetical protein